ncbi:hypothetical protein TNCV_933141 [Trichonephila clavipes]|nr:hypothetical protein TNCV_933141 [Trichonephila clavipes]
MDRMGNLCRNMNPSQITEPGLELQSEILTPNRICKTFEIHLSGVEASCYDPSRILIARSDPMLFTSPFPGGFCTGY